jgi:hypothetical protein
MEQNTELESSEIQQTNNNYQWVIENPSRPRTRRNRRNNDN